MTDMIERVARAIHARSDHASLWSELDGYSKIEYREDARAAIEAMREPTEEMVNGLRITRECDSTAALWAPHIWRTMIDTALGEEQ